MKRLLLLLLAIGAWSQTVVPYVAIRVTTLASATSGGVMHLVGTSVAYQKVTWTKTGTVTVCSLKVDGSADGITYGDGDVLGATDCSTNGTSAVITSNPNYIRVRTASWTGTGSVTITWTGYAVSPASVDLASPGPIGGTTPAAITGTTVNATTGFQVNGAFPANDVICGDGTNGILCVPGLATSRTDATASVTLNPSSTTGDRNKVVNLTNAGAIAVTTPATAVTWPDGGLIAIDNGTGTATLTPTAGTINGAASAIQLPSTIGKLRSKGGTNGNSRFTIEIEPDANGKVPATLIPAPTASTLGGTESITCPAGQHVNTISTSGVPGCTADSGGGGTTFWVSGTANSNLANPSANASLVYAMHNFTGGTFSNLILRVTAQDASSGTAGHVYSIGIYGPCAPGGANCPRVAYADTINMAVGGSAATITIALTGAPATLAAPTSGQYYYILWTTSCASACGTLSNTSNYESPIIGGSGGATTNGLTNATITVPAVSVGHAPIPLISIY